MKSKVYTLSREQIIPADMETTWGFFSAPRNLEEITPNDIGFKILECSHDKMVEGQIIKYKIKVFPLIWITWVTEINEVKEESHFTDTQLKGPYTLWRHTHTFESHEYGVFMKDVVKYSMPFGILGRIVHSLFIKNKLENIFNHRCIVLAQKSWS